MSVRKLKIENESLRVESTKSMEKIKEMNRIINFEKVNLESSKEDNLLKMQEKVKELESKLKNYQIMQNNEFKSKNLDNNYYNSEILTKKAYKSINNDINHNFNDILNLKNDPSNTDSKVSENDTNEFLLTEVDKIVDNDKTDINKNSLFNQKLKLNDI